MIIAPTLKFKKMIHLRHMIGLFGLLYSIVSSSDRVYSKIILHKDINKTIIAEDPASDKTIDDVLIHSLAEECCDCWDERIVSPISYVQYIKN